MSSAPQPSRGRAAIAALIVVLVVFGASFGVRKATASSAQAAPLPAPIVVILSAGARLRVSRRPLRRRRCIVRPIGTRPFPLPPHTGEHSDSDHDPGVETSTPGSATRTPSTTRRSERRQRQRPGARGLVSMSA